MPCGGIFPTTQTEGPCTFVCGKPGARHFCDEWDTYIHAVCAVKFLSTPEGEIILKHKHQVRLDFNLEREGT